MEVHLTSDQEAFIDQRVRAGRFASANEAVQEAVSLLREREAETAKERPASRKSLARLFAESPFRGLDMEFPRDNEPLRSIEL